MIHFRKHDHLVQDDMCKDRLEEIKALIEDEVYHTWPNIKNFAIGLFTLGSFLSQHQFNYDGNDLNELWKENNWIRWWTTLHPCVLSTFIILLHHLNIIPPIKDILTTFFCLGPKIVMITFKPLFSWTIFKLKGVTL
jgi:hypothetical protein